MTPTADGAESGARLARSPPPTAPALVTPPSTRPDIPPADGSKALDLRMPAIAAGAWAGALLGPWVSHDPWPRVPLLAALLGTVLAVGAVVGAARLRPDVARTLLAVVAVGAVVGGLAAAREAHVVRGPVGDLARQGAAARVLLDITGDPKRVAGAYGDQVFVRARAEVVTGRGESWQVRSPVLVLTAADGASGRAWSAVVLGSRVAASGVLAEPFRRGPGEPAAVLRARGSPETLAEPGVGWRAAAAVRASLRRSVEHRPPAERVLVPALVAGDDRGLDEGVAEDFRTTGLTHLTAVSGTNLTLVVGFLLVLARGLGVRGRWLRVVALLGIGGFVLLARTEPSVVRAAAMGTVALLALGGNARHRGLRALGVAVTALLLAQPGLATTVGFALSVSATAGILLFAPAWRDALGRWLPRWLAEAVAVPATAQLACTPLVAGISGQVSLVAVLANLLVAPVVGPATVLGLAGGVVGLAWEPAGRVLGTAAAWCVGWIVAVARWGADRPLPALDWATTPIALAALTALCAALALLAPRVLARPRLGAVLLVVLLAVGLVRPPSLRGLPLPWRSDVAGTDWSLAACDVGQGDALLLRTAPGSAVLVDTGPDARAVRDCLDLLDVRRVPLVVLTHFHADHVDGLAGVLASRPVGGILVSPLADPADGAREVAALARAHGVPVEAVTAGATVRSGPLVARVLWPLPGAGPPATGDGSEANDASVVLLAELAGLRILLTGDVEPPAQAGLAGALAGERVDVLKVPHHGSRHQDMALLTALGADVAVVSVGADNRYGHPAPGVLAGLEESGARVVRTDRDGTVVLAAADEGADDGVRVRLEP